MRVYVEQRDSVGMQQEQGAPRDGFTAVCTRMYAFGRCRNSDGAYPRYRLRAQRSASVRDMYDSWLEGQGVRW